MSDEFWDAVEPLLAEGGLAEETIMGGPWRELVEGSIGFVTG